MKTNLNLNAEKVQAWWNHLIAGRFSELVEENTKSGATFSSQMKKVLQKACLTNWVQAVGNLNPNFSIPFASKEEKKAVDAVNAAMAQEVRLDVLGYHMVCHICDILRIKTRSKLNKQFNTEELFSLPEVAAWELLTYQGLEDKIVESLKITQAATKQAAEGNVRPRRVPRGVELL